eukprot:6194971-Pleurochrysis_carterae.AAC.4
MKSKGQTRKKKHEKRETNHSRETLIRMRKWTRARNLKYEGKVERKFRHKVRASKCWLERQENKEETEANRRKQHRRKKRDQEGINTTRKGGAGKGSTAKRVKPSSREEEILPEIGIPQYTWGDGSCWLWAVAGAMGKLEGRNGPTENDIQLERTWRKEILDTVSANGLPMTEDEGKLIRGGTWGGGTEHQALAMILRTNIVIWDRKYIGRV